MPQYDPWEKEYSSEAPALLSKGDKPQSDTLRFFKFLKKEQKIDLENLNVLDLGSGTGRNSNYLAALGNKVVGLEISDSAIKIAEASKPKTGDVKYLKRSIGEKYPFPDNFFDLILDITSSNSLSDKEREIYLSETERVLKQGGWFFVKALCKDGDKNAQNLLKISPGKDPDTYFMKELGLQEKVFSKESFVDLYSRYFKIIRLEKKTNYTSLNNRKYKRNFWLAYMAKRR